MVPTGLAAQSPSALVLFGANVAPKLFSITVVHIRNTCAKIGQDILLQIAKKERPAQPFVTFIACWLPVMFNYLMCHTLHFGRYAYDHGIVIRWQVLGYKVTPDALGPLLIVIRLVSPDYRCCVVRACHG